MNQTYVDAVAAAGGSPLLVPSTAPLQLDRLDGADGVLLPGGPDVSPARYRQAVRGSVDIDEQRDQLELDLLAWALGSGRPVLAICRGFQILNVWAGGSLIQDLTSERPLLAHPEGGPRDGLVHDLTVAPGSRLASLIGSATVRVNSLHHQAVDQLGEGLSAVAHASDGTIEGIEAREGWAVGVQFHPEELLQATPFAEAIFLGFIAACKDFSAEAARTGAALAS